MVVLTLVMQPVPPSSVAAEGVNAALKGPYVWLIVYVTDFTVESLFPLLQAIARRLLVSLTETAVA